MRFDIRRIKKDARNNFEKTWIESPTYIRFEKSNYKVTKGSSHVVFDIIQKLRDAYIEIGFREHIVPTIIEDTHVKKQYGPEAYAILDRCY